MCCKFWFHFMFTDKHYFCRDFTSKRISWSICMYLHTYACLCIIKTCFFNHTCISACTRTLLSSSDSRYACSLVPNCPSAQLSPCFSMLTVTLSHPQYICSLPAARLPRNLPSKHKCVARMEFGMSKTLIWLWSVRDSSLRQRTPP